MHERYEVISANNVINTKVPHYHDDYDYAYDYDYDCGFLFFGGVDLATLARAPIATIGSV
jgi:hypothetical protein